MSAEKKPATPVPCPSCNADVRGRFCPECGTLARNAPCKECGATLAPGDRFCGECGAPVGVAAAAAAAAEPAEPWRPSTTWKVVTIALAATLVVALFMRFGSDRPQGRATPLDPAATQSGAPAGGPSAGILSMPPQQQADALFDRVMRLNEEGKRDSVQFFAPMAIGIYEQLQPLDLDQRFDMGTIALAAGMYPTARAQADTILQQDPDHLLGLALLSRSARASGATADARRADVKFAKIVQTEVRKAPEKIEYQRHKSDIEIEVKRLAGITQ